MSYASTNFTYTNTLAALTLKNTGGGTAALQLDSGDLLQINGTVVVSNGGRLTLGSGALLTNHNANTGAKLNIGGGGAVTMTGGAIYLPNNAFTLNDGSWTQSGGNVIPNGTLTMADAAGQTATLNLSGGMRGCSCVCFQAVSPPSFAPDSAFDGKLSSPRKAQ